MSSSQRKPVVIVTGASRGIGLAATSILLDTFHAAVVAISRSRSSQLSSLLEKHPSDLLIIKADVTDEQEMRQAISLVLSTYKAIDGLILNAGTIEPVARIGEADTTTDMWREHFDLNLFSLFYTVQAALPALRDSELGGRVIFVSSGAAIKGTPALGAYNASKAAMNSFCHTLAEEEPGIVSVALRPGMVDTPMQTAIRDVYGSKMRSEDYMQHEKAHKEGKLVKPEDAGHVIAALALRAAKSLSGQFVSWNSDECKDYRRF